MSKSKKKEYNKKEILRITKEYRDLLLHVDERLHAIMDCPGIPLDVQLEEDDGGPILLVWMQKGTCRPKHIVVRLEDLYGGLKQNETKDLFSQE